METTLEAHSKCIPHVNKEPRNDNEKDLNRSVKEANNLRWHFFKKIISVQENILHSRGTTKTSK